MQGGWRRGQCKEGHTELCSCASVLALSVAQGDEQLERGGSRVAAVGVLRSEGLKGQRRAKI